MGMRAAVVTLAGEHEHEQDEDGLTAGVVHLLNVGVVVDQNGVRCAMCNERNDEHTSECPIPLLEAWLERE